MTVYRQVSPVDAYHLYKKQAGQVTIHYKLKLCP